MTQVFILGAGFSKAVGTSCLPSSNSATTCWRGSTTRRWPAGSSAMISAGPPRGPVPKLMKLHGSLNWRYSAINAPITEARELAVPQGPDFTLLRR
ncbi:hypothetical protein [Catellatospora methionotrophica]|uniref:hypothetical protein n=1 Tax=Catellatospora methionotrophica TaxID=121620 RepID=UPI0033F6C165